MRNFTLTVLAALTVLLLAVGGVTAYGSNDTTSNHDPVPETVSVAEWTATMEQHVTERMGADAAVQMQDRMGMNSKEMGEHMTSRQNGSMMNGWMMDGMMNGRMMGGMIDGSMDGMMSGSMSGIGCH